MNTTFTIKQLEQGLDLVESAVPFMEALEQQGHEKQLSELADVINSTYMSLHAVVIQLKQTNPTLAARSKKIGVALIGVSTLR